jgi:hypothetical protein
VSDPVSMEGRVLVGVSNVGDGEVGSDTVFRFHQVDDVVWAEYQGGDIRRGFLVGTSDGATLEFRYAHLGIDGRTASGRSVDSIEVLDGGRVRLNERWAWDSREGSGESVLEERTRPDG